MVPDTRGTCHFETLAEMALWRGAEMPDRVAFTFLSYKSANAFEAEELTYGRLLDESKSIAATLQQSSRCGDRVLILCPAGLSYVSAFFGCQLSGMVAVPAYPPRNVKHMERLRGIDLPPF